MFHDGLIFLTSSSFVTFHFDFIFEPFHFNHHLLITHFSFQNRALGKILSLQILNLIPQKSSTLFQQDRSYLFLNFQLNNGRYVCELSNSNDRPGLCESPVRPPQRLRVRGGNRELATLPDSAARPRLADYDAELSGLLQPRGLLHPRSLLSLRLRCMLRYRSLWWLLCFWCLWR